MHICLQRLHNNARGSHYVCGDPSSKETDCVRTGATTAVASATREQGPHLADCSGLILTLQSLVAPAKVGAQDFAQVPGSKLLT